MLPLLVAACGMGEPGKIEKTVRPGSTAVFEFKAKPTDKSIRAQSYIEAHAIVDPDPLPQGAVLLHTDLLLHNSGVVSGDVLLFVPETAIGDLEFNVSASGDGRSASGGNVFFKTSQKLFQLSVEGPPVKVVAPILQGNWKSETLTWSFSDQPSHSVAVSHASGDRSVFQYELYPDGAGRWFLIDARIGGQAYWIEMDSEAGALFVSWPGTEFAPFAELVAER